MKLGVYAVHDAAVKLFCHPFYARSNEEAARMLMMSASDTIVVKSPEHFSLYRIGWFEEESGLVESSEPKEFVIRAVDFVTKIEEVNGNA